MKGIYKITNTINNKVYIGQSDRLNQREREHFYRLENQTHSNEHLQRSYNKHGKDIFLFEIIEETDDLDNRELYFINENGGINSDLNYNLKDPLTMKWSDYVRVKQSKSMMGENNPNFGNKWTEEQKDEASKKKLGVTLEDRLGKDKADLAKSKMSNSQTGRKHPDEVKEKIREANLGENNPAYGKGERQGGDKNPMWGKPCKTRTPIQQFTKEGVFVKEYDYISQVKEYGFGPSNVMYCARGAKNYKTVGGFIWKFKE
jgi:group I intron endonuclease